MKPGDAEAHFYLARCLIWAGQPEEAYDEMKVAIRLDPQNVEAPYFTALGRVAFAAGRYAEPVSAYERNSALGGPSYLGNVVMWSAACSLAGNGERARELIRDMQQEKPDVSLANIAGLRNYSGEAELELVRDALRAVGLPEK